MLEQDNSAKHCADVLSLPSFEWWRHPPCPWAESAESGLRVIKAPLTDIQICYDVARSGWPRVWARKFLTTAPETCGSTARSFTSCRRCALCRTSAAAAWRSPSLRPGSDRAPPTALSWGKDVTGCMWCVWALSVAANLNICVRWSGLLSRWLRMSV